MIVVFAGSIGRFPVGGHAWVDLQYLLGLRDLGHEVFYLEECGEGSWVYNWQTERITTDLAYPTSYVARVLEPVGLGDRWIYRAGDGSVGMDPGEFGDVCRNADLLIVRGVPLDVWRDEYALPRRRVYVDSDPGFTQFKLARGHRALAETTDRCHRLFTVGHIDPDGPIPTCGRPWVPMLPPVHLASWPTAPQADATYFTAVMQWKSYGEVVHDGVSYGNKNLEFPKFIDLPRLTAQPMRLAVTGVPPGHLSRHGWEVTTGWKAVWTPQCYVDFIGGSRAEFGVAKQGYVATRSGWISDRTACYLASGRPALVQDTGIGRRLPLGQGLLTFGALDEAVTGIERINGDYTGHRRAARRLAERYFASDRVLGQLVACALDDSPPETIEPVPVRDCRIDNETNEV